MTTNGLRLAALAPDLRAAGLARVNVSLDTLDRDRFIRLTRRDRLSDVLDGLAAAAGAGFDPVKLNAVVMRGVNDDEVVDLVRFAVDHGYEMRFIEQMPLDPGHTWDRGRMVTQTEVLDRLRGAFRLAAVGDARRCTRRAMADRRRARNGGRDRVGDGTVLRLVRPPATHCRRAAAVLPVRADRDRPARPGPGRC